MSICLAVTCHDAAGVFATGVADAAKQLGRAFGAIAVNATDETAQTTIEALESQVPVLRYTSHQAGTIGIGTARRDALALALGTDCSHISLLRHRPRSQVGNDQRGRAARDPCPCV